MTTGHEKKSALFGIARTFGSGYDVWVQYHDEIECFY